MFSFLRGLSGRVGRRASASIATAIAKCYCATQPGIVDVVARNLKLLSHPTPQHSAPKVFANYARTLADYFWMAGRPRAEAASLADVEGFSLVLPDASGAVLATGHFGFFEFGALALAEQGIPVSVVTHAEPAGELTRWRADYRQRWGAETIELGNDAFSSLRVVAAIQSGQLTAMLIDRPMGGRTMDVALPGGTIPFSTAPALLSWVLGCPVIPVTVRRTPHGRFAVQTGRPVVADRSLPRDQAINDCTRQIAESLIAEFRRDPLQWYHFVPLADGSPA
jgi:lauroyl/myristoyl acyltransferase